MVTVAPGVELYVERRGVGSPLMLLHGFTGDTTTMSGLTTRLADHAEVFVADLIGHGRSSVSVDEAHYSIEAMVSHVAALAERLADGSFHLVGYSMGGRVALAFACRHRELLRSLTLIGASAGLVSETDRAKRREADYRLAESIEREGLVVFVDKWMTNPLFASQAQLGDEFLAESRAQRLANSPTGLMHSLRAAGTGAMAPLHGGLGDCNVPTTFVVGAKDAKFTAIAFELAALMPSADIALIEDAGHAAHLEQPDAVAEVICAKLGSKPTWD